MTAFGISCARKRSTNAHSRILHRNALSNNNALSSTQLWATNKKYGRPTAKATPTTSTSRRAASSDTRKRRYSQATTARLQGLNAQEELAKLARKLNTPQEKLRPLLTQRLAAIDRSTGTENEKAEYLDWLLSAGSHNGAVDAPKQKKKLKPAQKASNTSGDEQTFATNVKFADRADLHSHSKRAITEAMGLTTMTEIQDKTFAAASSGRDVLGRARTGTGKTLAFLLPAIERILQLGTTNTGGQIGILVVSPTRELATQIGDQAEMLTSFHRGMSVQVMFGGTNVKTDINKLTKKLPTILVATPGRLLDHMQSTRIGNQQFGKGIMSHTPLVILDETDRLLDMGFRRDLQKILAFLPTSQERQTLLFSATIPPDLKAIMAQNMKPDFIEVDCINDGDAATHTNAQVQQSHIILPSKKSDRFVSSVVEVVRLALDKHDSTNNPAKIVVFFPTARLVNFFAELFNQGSMVSVPVLELHSKKSQSYRNRVSENFRNLERGVLFTSDVSARGESSIVGLH